MKQKKGISLIVLVVVIIVMLIIAGAIIISLNNTNVIDMASKAIKDYGDKEFEEGLTLIYSDNLIGNYTGKSFNNKKVANDILDMFGYPNIDETTGLVEGGESGTLTTDKYTVESQDGQVKITDINSKEILLQVLYDKANKPDFKVVYNNVIYTYDNLNLLSKSAYYKEGVAEDWTYTENTETGTLTLTAFNGEVQADANGLKHLTVPNKLNGKVVSTARIYSTNALKEINGTLTVSPGITVEKIDTTNITKVVLEENVITKHITWDVEAIKGNNITDLVIKSGCNIGKRPVTTNMLTNIIMGNNVILQMRAFEWCHSLTSESINNILEKATFWGEQVFFACNFKNPVDIVVAENSKITKNIIHDCTNINSVTVKRGAIINPTSVAEPFIDCPNTTINKLTIEDKCYLYYFITSYTSNSGLIINEVEIKNSVTLDCNNIDGIKTNKLTIGNNCIMQGDRPIRNVTELKKIEIGDNFKINMDGYYNTWYTNTLSNLSDLEELVIGDNANITGKMGMECPKLTKVTIGENAKLVGAAFSLLPSIEEVTIGKGATIGINEFKNCTNLKTITLYLTEEQAADRSKIPTSWQANVPNATFAVRDENDTEKIIWDVTYPEPATN